MTQRFARRGKPGRLRARGAETIPWPMGTETDLDRPSSCRILWLLCLQREGKTERSYLKNTVDSVGPWLMCKEPRILDHNRIELYIWKSVHEIQVKKQIEAI